MLLLRDLVTRSTGSGGFCAGAVVFLSRFVFLGGGGFGADSWGALIEVDGGSDDVDAS